MGIYASFVEKSNNKEKLKGSNFIQLSRCLFDALLGCL